MSGPVDELLAEGREALRRGDGPAARAAFAAAIPDDPAPPAEVVEGLARASYLELDFRAAIDGWERAYAAHRATGNDIGAVRVARTLACMYGMIVGDGAVCAGWLARAQTLLGPAGDDGRAGGDGRDDTTAAEVGWVRLTVGMFAGERAAKDEHLRAALAVARRSGDTDLELVTLAYLGASLVHGDRTEEGMTLLDEALAAVAGGEVDDFFVLEEVFCQLFAACEHAQDVTRADAWIRIGEAIAERRNLPAVSAFCRTHYGGVLTAAGRWPEAEAALVAAVRLWGLGERAGLRTGALVRLADLRSRQGRFEEAEQLLEGLGPDDTPEAARPRAAALLARGEPDVAREVLERALTEVDPASTTAAPLLALLVDVHLAAGRPGDAAAAADALGAVAARAPGHHYLHAAAALAQGRACLASRTGDPGACLRRALAGFARAGMPVEVARARLDLAALVAADRPALALAEARAALEAFERLQAARDADEAAALLRSLGVRATAASRGRPRGGTTGTAAGPGTGGAGPAGGGAGSGPGVSGLTRREDEVLALLGHGLTNPEIAERLYISRKTVEHHVGNVLAKLGLRSRAEAAAYVTRTAKPAGS